MPMWSSAPQFPAPPAGGNAARIPAAARLLRPLAVVGSVALVIGLLGRPTVEASARLNATPTPPGAGGALLIDGSGFAGRQQGTVALDDARGSGVGFRADASGSFRVNLPVSPLEPRGRHTVMAVADVTDQTLATTTVDVTAATTQVDLVPSGRTSGSSARPSRGSGAGTAEATPGSTPWTMPGDPATADPTPVWTPDPTVNPTPFWTPTPTPVPTPNPTPVPTPKPTPLPTPLPTPPAGQIPAMPAGDLLQKDFSDGTLYPFRAITYPNAHPSDPMSYACRYGTGSDLISVHDGYLDLRAIPGSSFWSCAFVSTGMDGNGHGASFSLTTGYMQFAARLNVGYATWQAPIWLLNTVTGWNAAEIDAAEVINRRLTFNLHGVGDLQVASVAPPANLASSWHVFGVAKAADHITFTMDGRTVGRWNGSMPDPVALLADSKVGYQWSGVLPNATTPDPTYVNLAWVTVSSTIPVGL